LFITFDAPCFTNYPFANTIGYGFHLNIGGRRANDKMVCDARQFGNMDYQYILSFFI
jgi:hypothetical protein